MVPFFPVQLFRAGFGLSVRRWAGSSMQKDFSSIPEQTSCVLIKKKLWSVDTAL